MSHWSYPFLQDQVYWYLNESVCPPLRTKHVVVDAVVIGGGMAGIHAAYALRKKGLSVALLEKNVCGAGATGKSSGFITPDSELSLSKLIKIYGSATAQQLWEFVVSGVELIRHNIHEHKLQCDYQQQDTLVVATSKHDFNTSIYQEHEARLSLGYPSTLYTQATLVQHIGSDHYYGAVRYPDTFGICAYRYCQAMKQALLQHGVAVYEDTPAINIDGSIVSTAHGTIQGAHIIVCVDRFSPLLNILPNLLYPVQTFLLFCHPLEQTLSASLFPDQPFMVWDTKLIYHYFRLTGDNRLMLGGARLWSTYAGTEQYHQIKAVKNLTSYFGSYFPHIPVSIEYLWPGLIGLSPDLLPLAGPDRKNPHVYYIGACAGLPWAAALGQYSALWITEKRTDLDPLFSAERTFPLAVKAQSILGKRLWFALSNFLRTRSL